jgi:hypothetical protein
MQPVTTSVIALSGNPIAGAQVEMTAGKTVVKGNTDSSGTFSGTVPIQVPLDIWVRRRGTNLGYGNSIWFHAASLTAAQRMTIDPLAVTVHEHTPSRGLGTKSVGTTDLFGSIIGGVNQVFQSIPGLAQINTAGAQTAQVVQQAGAATEQAAQSAGAATVQYVSQVNPGVGAAVQSVARGAVNLYTNPINSAVKTQYSAPVYQYTGSAPSIPQQAAPDLGSIFSGAQSAMGNIDAQLASIFGVGTAQAIQQPNIPVPGSNTIFVDTPSPDTMKQSIANAATNLGNQTAPSSVSQALAGLQTPAASLVQQAVAAGAAIPAEQLPGAIDVILCGYSQSCVQAKYNQMNAGRNAAIKLWQQNVQAASMVANPPSVAAPSGISAAEFTSSINDFSHAFTVDELNAYAQQAGVSQSDVMNAIIEARNVSAGRATGITSKSSAILNALGDTSVPGVQTMDISTPGSTTVGPVAPSLPSTITPMTADTVPGSQLPPGVSAAGVQQNGQTLTASDASGNVWVKYGKDDWHLIKGVVTTPEGVQLGGFTPATVSGYYDSSGTYHPGTSGSDAGVVNPTTGQTWSGDVGTMSALVTDVINPPVTTRDGHVCATCADLAKFDPLRRQGAAWTQCDANQAWRSRFLYQNADTGAVQNDAIATLAQNQAGAAQAAVNALQAAITSGETPAQIQMYQANLNEYQANLQNLQAAAVAAQSALPAAPSSSVANPIAAGNPALSNQQTIPSPNDLATTVITAPSMNINQRYSISDILLAGGTRLP